MWEVKSHWTVTLIDESNDLYLQLMVAINLPTLKISSVGIVTALDIFDHHRNNTNDGKRMKWLPSN